MDIYYCDNCGDVLLADDAQRSMATQTLCSKCRTASGVADGASAEASHSPPQEAASEDLNDYSMSSFVNEQDLFSSDTIARRKQPTTPKPRKSSSLTLVDEAPVSKPTNQGPKGPQRDGLAVFDEPLRMTGELDQDAAGGYSAADANGGRTPAPVTGGPAASIGSAGIDIQPGQNPPGQYPGQSGGPGSGAHDPGNFGPGAGTAVMEKRRTPERTTPASPAPSGGPPQKLKLKCVACPAKFAIAPVAKRSRLTCPKCDTKMIIDPRGHLELCGGSAAVPNTPSPALAGPTPPTQISPLQAPPDALLADVGQEIRNEISPEENRYGAQPGSRSLAAEPQVTPPAAAPPERAPIMAPATWAAGEVAAGEVPAGDAAAGRVPAGDMAAGTVAAFVAENAPAEYNAPELQTDPNLAAAPPLDPIANADPTDAATVAADRAPALRPSGSLGIIFWLVAACLPISIGLMLSTPHVPETAHHVILGFGDNMRDLAGDLLTWLGRRAP